MNINQLGTELNVLITKQGKYLLLKRNNEICYFMSKFWFFVKFYSLKGKKKSKFFSF